MGNSADRRSENRERIRVWREWLTSFGEGADKQAKIYLLVALGLAFLFGGLPMIGVSVNLPLGAFMLAGAFACATRALWLWEGFSKFHAVLRWSTLALAGILYFGWAGWQMWVQYEKDHPVAVGQAKISAPIQSGAPVSRADLIYSWRAMISEIATKYPMEKGFTDDQVSAAIQRHLDFQSLRPHLSGESLRQLAKTTNFFYGAKIQSILMILQGDVDRIEREWTDIVLELTPFVILKRTLRHVEKEVHAFQDYGLAAILHIVNKEAEPRYIGRLEVEGDVSVDCSEYLYPFGKEGQDIRDIMSDCKNRKPYYHISWVATPIGETRVDPKGGERFIRFVILQPQSGGRVYSSLPGQQPDVKGYFGFESGGIKPRILTTVPYVFDLVYFAAVSPEGEGRDPGLRSEVDQGKVIIRVTVNSKIQALLRAQVMSVRWKLDTQWEAGTPQDLFYAIDSESRSMPVQKDPLMQPSH